MNLWIRSQDKKHLMKVEALMYEETGTGFGIRAFTKNYDFNIANYKTKKRALEVLDEIENILNLKDMYKNDRELVLKGWENVDIEQVKIVRQQMSVYEMPKE